ncbi:translation initiation factor IF-2-like [Coturnix japonica]|uniref:translation initiation factor IF-2-like n=1 Tax=Coturnix japonica TaxID=93934 RepID=UPI000777E0CA|nr:translation initiation factor IF-2-like [Coturnix japonica]
MPRERFTRAASCAHTEGGVQPPCCPRASPFQHSAHHHFSLNKAEENPNLGGNKDERGTSRGGEGSVAEPGASCQGRGAAGGGRAQTIPEPKQTKEGVAAARERQPQRAAGSAAAPLARPHPRGGSGGGRRAAGRSLPPGEGRPETGGCAPPRHRRRADNRRRPPAARPAATGGCHSSGAGGRGRGRAAATRNFAGPEEGCSAALRRSPPQSFTPKTAGCGSDSSGTAPPSPAAPPGTRKREKGTGSTRWDGGGTESELSLLPSEARRGRPPRAASPPPSAALPPAPPGASFVGRPVPPRRAAGPRPRGRRSWAGARKSGPGGSPCSGGSGPGTIWLPAARTSLSSEVQPADGIGEGRAPVCTGFYPTCTSGVARGEKKEKNKTNKPAPAVAGFL